MSTDLRLAFDNLDARAEASGGDSALDRISLRDHQIDVEIGASLYGFPVELWYRNGYMTDLADYYRKLESAGVRVSFWIF